ncbi:SWI/SNF complex subunit Snf59 [Schizosaccharomyces japonicus yFS275]|uniref:SWI/SNF complex subunit Snf59 n=1 Tax=Schizosaccharomyces japonicus (strain yFS275 / FY16936) TaxID=402676 RepID=B6K5M9_SCHJY|nr:SWI/SNF complex subunit Snf59 [Schizosaccharomyces japonicus yFS275]EEB08833.1 SWI/SNF complex subunit Snf59 [Schizosaccharomyces japonicus yFS275]
MSENVETSTPPVETKIVDEQVVDKNIPKEPTFLEGNEPTNDEKEHDSSNKSDEDQKTELNRSTVKEETKEEHPTHEQEAEDKQELKVEQGQKKEKEPAGKPEASLKNNQTTEKKASSGTTDDTNPGNSNQGITKIIDKYGRLQNGLEYKARTFCLTGRGNVLYMLGTECARLLGFKDSYFLFHKTPSLRKIVTTPAEKEELIQMGLLLQNFRSRQVSIVPARQIFMVFGARILVHGSVDPSAHKMLFEQGIAWADDEYHKLDSKSTVSSSAGTPGRTDGRGDTPSESSTDIEPTPPDDFQAALRNAVDYNAELFKERKRRLDAAHYFYYGQTKH